MTQDLSNFTYKPDTQEKHRQEWGTVLAMTGTVNVWRSVSGTSRHPSSLNNATRPPGTATIAVLLGLLEQSQDKQQAVTVSSNSKQ